MIERPSGHASISSVHPESGHCAGTVQDARLGPAERIGLHRAAEIVLLHHEDRNFRHARTDVQASAAAMEPTGKRRGDREPKSLRRPTPVAPERQTAFIAVNPSERPVIQAIEG